MHYRNVRVTSHRLMLIWFLGDQLKKQLIGSMT